MADSLCPECGAPLRPDGVCGACLVRKGAAADQGTTRSAVSTLLERPAQIGSYQVLDTLGEGGMGIVYLAQQEKPLRRRVALKIIKVGMDTREVVARFEAERQALALMDHPNIAQVYDAGATDDGRPYFVMEPVPGVPITEYCDKHRLSTRSRLELFAQVCAAVQHAHQKGIIHRDIKPSNVLVMVQDGRPLPKVIDFGVAKAIHQRLTEKTVFTQFGLLIGTPEYMSPEQAEMGGLNVDTTTDIYSLGIVLYELLVGALPFDPARLRAAGYGEIQRIIRDEEPLRPSTRLSGLGVTAAEIASRRRTDVPTLRRELKGDLDWVTLKAMDKDRTRRYASASELEADVLRYLTQDVVLARPASVAYRLRKLRAKHRVAAAAVAVVLISLAGGAVASYVMYTRAEIARENAERQSYAAMLAAVDAQILTAEVRRSDTPRGSDTPQLMGTIWEAERRLADIPVRLRGWEWSYLAAKLDGSVAKLWGATPPSAGAPNEVRAGDMTLFAYYLGRIGLSKNELAVYRSTTRGVHRWNVDDHRFSGAWPGAGVVYALADDGSYLLSMDDRLPKPWRIVSTETGATRATLDERRVHEFRHATFAADGGYLATVDANNSISVWAVESGDRIAVATLRVAPSFVTIAAGRNVLVAGANDELYVWPFTRDRTPHILKSGSAAKIRDGVLAGADDLVTLDSTGSVRWWRLASGEAIAAIGQHIGATEIAAADDGSFAATGGFDGVVHLWARPGTFTPRDEAVIVLDAHEPASPIDAIRFSRDGRRLFTASNFGSLCVWDVRKARLAVGVTPLRPIFPFGLSGLSANARFAVIVRLNEAIRLDADTLEATPIPLTALRGAQIDKVSSPADTGDDILLGKDDGTILRWRATDGGVLSSQGKLPGRITAMAISRDARRAAAAAVEGPFDQRLLLNPSSAHTLLRVWDLATNTEIAKVEMGGAVGSLAFDEHANRLLVTRRTGPVTTGCVSTVGVWNLEKGLVQTDIPECGVAAFSPGGIHVITHSIVDGRFRVWNGNGSIVRASRPIRDVGPLAVSPDGRRLAAGTAAGVEVFDFQSLDRLLVMSTPDRPQVLRFSPDGSRLVATTSSKIRVFDARPEYDPEVRAIIRELGRRPSPGSNAFSSVGPVSPLGPLPLFRWVYDMEQDLQLNKDMDPILRRRVIDEITKIGDRDVEALCKGSAAIVVRRDATREQYQQALRNAARGTELAPWAAFCVGTLGIAKYRVEDYDGALAGFDRAKRIRGEARPSELAVAAMAFQRLGRRNEAAAVFDELRKGGHPPEGDLAAELASIMSSSAVPRR
jgi:serine/threonine protein kinase/WD40 repeat protein